MRLIRRFLEMFKSENPDLSRNTKSNWSLVAEINGYRINSGLPTLKEDPELTRLAQYYADKAKHDGDFLYMRTSIRHSIHNTKFNGLHCLNSQGECTGLECIEKWAADPRNRCMILDTYDAFGAAESRNKNGRSYYCAIFATK